MHSDVHSLPGTPHRVTDATTDAAGSRTRPVGPGAGAASVIARSARHDPISCLIVKVLVTGGAGFIGSNLAVELVRLGYTVRVLDNFATGHRSNLAGLK